MRQRRAELQVDGLHPEEGEVREVYPVFAVLVSRKVTLSCESGIALDERLDLANQCSSRTTEGITIGHSLRNAARAVVGERGNPGSWRPRA